MQIEIKFVGDTDRDALLFGLLAKALSDFNAANGQVEESKSGESVADEPAKPKRIRKKKDEESKEDVIAQFPTEPMSEETPAAEEAPAAEEPSDDLPFTPEVEETPAPVVEEKAPVVDAEYWRAALREKRVELGVDSTDERNREFLDWIRTTSETFGDRTPSHLPADKLAGFVGYFKQLKWTKENGFHVPSAF